MTAPRRPRSARLLVSSTPSVWVKVERAGQRLRRFLAKSRWYLVRALLRAALQAAARPLRPPPRDPRSLPRHRLLPRLLQETSGLIVIRVLSVVSRGTG